MMAFTRDPQLDQFRVFPTSPPSTRLYMRGGTLVEWGDGYVLEFPAATVDLADSAHLYGSEDSPLYDHTQNYPIVFTTPYYYRVYTLTVKMPYNDEVEWRLFDLETEQEFATAVEAETAWPLTLDYFRDPSYEGYPLCGLILRNNGTVNMPGQIQAIEAVNRGRSYTWPRDTRPLVYVP